MNGYGAVRVQSTKEDGICLFRDNLMVAFYGKRPFAEMVNGAAWCFDQYLKMIPKDALSWSLIGSTADTNTPLGAKDIARCKAMLTVATAKRKDIHFRLKGHDAWGPDYSLMVGGLKQPSQQGFLDQTNGIELMFPVGFLSSYGEDAFVATVMGMFETLQCDSGHAGIALVPGAPADFTEAGTHIAPRLMRSHGLDIGLTMFVVNKLGDRCRGARWLTMLSDKLVDELGGRDALAGKLKEGVTVVPGAHGLLMRAGHSPEIGDMDSKQTTPLLASVAQAIEGVTRFHNKGMLQFFNDDPEEMYRWERRFWW
jgi:hypothetical protein